VAVETIHQRMSIFPSLLGWAGFTCRGAKLTRVSIGHPSKSAVVSALKMSQGANVMFENAADELTERFIQFAQLPQDSFADVLIDESHLTSFGRRVVKHCRKIPLGETLTYGQLAAKAGSPGAARAVGSVMSANRFPLVVPCHRVVAADGRLGGFSAPQGVDLKRRMLRAEAEQVAVLS